MAYTRMHIRLIKNIKTIKGAGQIDCVISHYAPIIKIAKGYLRMKEINCEWTKTCDAADTEILLTYEEKLSESE